MIRSALAVWIAVALVSIPVIGQTPSSQPSQSAQVPPQASGQAVTVTGCVAPVQRDGSLGPKAAGTAASPESAPFEANNPEPTGKFILNDAAPIGSATSSSAAPVAQEKRTSYGLHGQEKELARHVGHRVEITGTLMKPVAAKVPSNSAKAAEGIRAVQVTAVKMLGTDCSPH